MRKCAQKVVSIGPTCGLFFKRPNMRPFFKRPNMRSYEHRHHLTSCTGPATALRTGQSTPSQAPSSKSRPATIPQFEPNRPVCKLANAMRHKPPSERRREATHSERRRHACARSRDKRDGLPRRVAVGVKRVTSPGPGRPVSGPRGANWRDSTGHLSPAREAPRRTRPNNGRKRN